MIAFILLSIFSTILIVFIIVLFILRERRLINKHKRIIEEECVGTTTRTNTGTTTRTTARTTSGTTARTTSGTTAGTTARTTSGTTARTTSGTTAGTTAGTSTGTTTGTGICMKYYTENKDIQKLMNGFQTLTTSLQLYGCDQLDSTNYQEALNNYLINNGEKITCAEVISSLDIKTIDQSEEFALVPLHIKKQIIALIKQIVELTCIEGYIDQKAFTNLVFELKNAICSKS
jgi:hypothetical protein